MRINVSIPFKSEYLKRTQIKADMNNFLSSIYINWSEKYKKRGINI